ncbi:MAG: hypothetical protein ACI4EN_07290 [Butyrivibrio sp.]
MQKNIRIIFIILSLCLAAAVIIILTLSLRNTSPQDPTVESNNIQNSSIENTNQNRTENGTITIDNYLQEVINIANKEGLDGWLLGIDVVDKNGASIEELHNKFIDKNDIEINISNSRKIFLTLKQLDNLVPAEGFNIYLSFSMETTSNLLDITEEALKEIDDESIIVKVYLNNECMKSVLTDLNEKNIYGEERLKRLNEEYNKIWAEIFITCNINESNFVYVEQNCYTGPLNAKNMELLLKNENVKEIKRAVISPFLEEY